MQERKATCFIAATANDIYRLPPEFLREGRFDEILFVDLPDAESRERLLKIHLNKRGLKPEDFDLKEIVDVTVGFSGAEIEQAIISALYRASTEKEGISTKHILEQIKSTKPLAVLKRRGNFRAKSLGRRTHYPRLRFLYISWVIRICLNYTA
jgi:SpoVK/Ycf46/Vps4 family AAA+-type ATPase